MPTAGVGVAAQRPNRTAKTTPNRAEITRWTSQPTATDSLSTSIATIGSMPQVCIRIPNTTPPARPPATPAPPRAGSAPAPTVGRAVVIVNLLSLRPLRPAGPAWAPAGDDGHRSRPQGRAAAGLIASRGAPGRASGALPVAEVGYGPLAAGLALRRHAYNAVAVDPRRRRRSAITTSAMTGASSSGTSTCTAAGRSVDGAGMLRAEMAHRALDERSGLGGCRACLGLHKPLDDPPVAEALDPQAVAHDVPQPQQVPLGGSGEVLGAEGHRPRFGNKGGCSCRWGGRGGRGGVGGVVVALL